MALSPAYISLDVRGTVEVTSTASIHMLNSLLLRRQFSWIKDKKGNRNYERTDDKRFTLSYAELEKPPFNFSQGRITLGKDELLAKGFIAIVNPGGAYEKDKTIVKLVDDYRNWKPDDPPIRTRDRDVHRGYQGKGLGAAHNNYRTRQRMTPTHTSTYDTPPKDTHVDV